MNNEPLTRGPETQPLSDSTPRRVPPKWVVDGWTDAEPSHTAIAAAGGEYLPPSAPCPVTLQPCTTCEAACERARPERETAPGGVSDEQ
jgi:hypothetical protein